MTVDTNLLDDLLRRMLAAGLRELEVEQGGVRIAMRLGGSPGAPAPSPVATIDVVTHAIGRFRTAHPRRAGESVKPGDAIRAGAVLGYLEVGPTLTGIVAPASGKIAEVVATEGQLLGYGARVLTLSEES